MFRISNLDRSDKLLKSSIDLNQINEVFSDDPISQDKADKSMAGFLDNDKNYIPKDYPKTFYCAKPEKLPIKSKWLYDINDVIYLGIHKETKFINKNNKINQNYSFYHFYNWSMKNKKKKHNNPIMIKTINFDF
jgi:hypothetical protein